jgi:RNA polymerase sigma-54 factor
MGMEYGIRLDLSQKLVMTPQLRQAIEILQLSALELSSMVEKELLENPVLEEDDSQSDSESYEEKVEKPVAEYLEWADYFNYESGDRSYASDQERPESGYASTAAASLQEQLEFQLRLSLLTEIEYKIGRYLIGSIDDNGYLIGNLADIAVKLKVEEPLVEKVLNMIQTFEPIGVGSRNLKECLTIQLKHQGIENDLVDAIVDHHLDDVAMARYKYISQKNCCTLHEVQEAVDIIRSLDPKPGRSFGGANELSYIKPDISVEKVNGEYIILVNDTDVPRLKISPYYRKVVREADAEAKKFVEGRISNAIGLIKSIEQRRRTLYNVAEALIELQQEFFDQGSMFLKPLTMKKVAERLGIHESTVSRAIANKYISTSHGLFTMRIFFTAGIQSADGQDVSASKIKREIKELINAENSTQPLSDQALADILNTKGIMVSRRTVAKYREEMEILSSAKRKRY